MPNKLTADEVKSIHAIIADAQADLGVSHFDVRLNVSDEPFDKDESPFSTMATINIEYSMLIAEITLYPHAVQSFRETPLKFVGTIYHEISHIIVNRYRDYVYRLLDISREYDTICMEAY